MLGPGGDSGEREGAGLPVLFHALSEQCMESIARWNDLEIQAQEVQSLYRLEYGGMEFLYL